MKLSLSSSSSPSSFEPLKLSLLGIFIVQGEQFSSMVSVSIIAREKNGNTFCILTHRDEYPIDWKKKLACGAARLATLNGLGENRRGVHCLRCRLEKIKHGKTALRLATCMGYIPFTEYPSPSPSTESETRVPSRTTLILCH